MKVAGEDHVCGRRVRATIEVNQVKTAEILKQNEQMLVEDAKMRRGQRRGAAAERPRASHESAART